MKLEREGKRGGRSDAAEVDCVHAACSGKEDDDKKYLWLLLLLPVSVVVGSGERGDVGKTG